MSDCNINKSHNLKLFVIIPNNVFKGVERKMFTSFIVMVIIKQSLNFSCMVDQKKKKKQSLDEFCVVSKKNFLERLLLKYSPFSNYKSMRYRIFFL